MTWKHYVAGGVVTLLVIAGPFITKDNTVAASLYGLITASLATGVGIWASWKYSQNSDKDRLTRYGLQAFRHVEGLSVKVSQKIQSGSADIETLQSWLIDIDQAKLSWKDLLRDLFELQERLKLQQEEVAQKFQKRIDSATDPSERKRLEEESRLEIAKIGAKSPLPIASNETVNCPNCGQKVSVQLNGEVGASAWPTCESCEALFPIHRRADSVILVNEDGMKLPVTRNCPYCNGPNKLKVQSEKTVHFRSKCNQCHESFQCDGSSRDLVLSKIAGE
jgi:transcription elongation factor Elf1